MDTVQPSVRHAQKSGKSELRFRWSGSHGKGAMAALRAEKHVQAEARNKRERVFVDECGHWHGGGQPCYLAGDAA